MESATVVGGLAAEGGANGAGGAAAAAAFWSLAPEGDAPNPANSP